MKGAAIFSLVVLGVVLCAGIVGLQLLRGALVAAHILPPSNGVTP